MERGLILMAVALMLGARPVCAQSEGGLILSAGAEKKVNKQLSVGVEADFRTRNDFKTVDRWSGSLGADYKLAKWLKADVGYVYENVVSQILTAAGNKLYYHTWPTPSGKHNYEIDFLLSRKAKICPIEVKSSTSNLHVSIDEFQKKFSARIQQRYLLHSKDIRKEQDLILLPMYMSMFL